MTESSALRDSGEAGRSEMSECERAHKNNTIDSDAWSKQNQPPRTEEYNERLVRAQKTKLRWDKVQRMALRWLSRTSFISSAAFHNMPTFEVMPSWFYLLGNLKIVHQRRKNERNTITSKGKGCSVRHVISPAESLNGVSIEKVMVSGDGRDVNGKLGIWRERVKLVLVCPRR